MASSRSSSAPHPLPSLPVEMKREILSFCDAPTLFQACLVSHSFLELASPFSYRDIVINGLKQFATLFYEEKPTSSAPHLDHFFSLSQLRTFTFLGVPDDGFTRYVIHITTARLPSPSPLRIETLDVQFGRRAGLGGYGYSEGENPELYSSILELFDPVHVAFTSPPGEDPYHMLPFPLELELKNWTRLESWSWSDVRVWPTRHFGSHSITTLEFLPQLQDNSLVLLFNLRKEPDYVRHVEAVCLQEVVAKDEDEEFWLWSCQKVKEVVLQVLSQEQRSRLLREMREYLGEGGRSGCRRDGENARAHSLRVRRRVILRSFEHAFRLATSLPAASNGLRYNYATLSISMNA